MKKFVTTRGYHKNATPTISTWSENSVSLSLRKHIPRESTITTAISFDAISETDSGIGTSDISETSTPILSPNVLLPFPAFLDEHFKSSDSAIERARKSSLTGKRCKDNPFSSLTDLSEHLEKRNSQSEEQFLKVLQNIRRTNMSYQNITSPSLDATATTMSYCIKSSETLPKRVNCSQSTSNLYNVSNEISSTKRFSTLKLKKKKTHSSSRSISNNTEVDESSPPVLVNGETSTFPRNFYKFRRKVPTLAKYSQNQVLVFNRSVSVDSESYMTSNDMTQSSSINIDTKAEGVRFNEKLIKPHNFNKLKSTGNLHGIPHGSNGNSSLKTNSNVTFNSTLPITRNSRNHMKPKFCSEQALTCNTNRCSLSKIIEKCSTGPFTSTNVSSLHNKYLGASSVQEALRDFTLWNDLLRKVASSDPPLNKILKLDDFNAKRMLCKRAIRNFAINVKNAILHYESSSFSDCVRLSCLLSYADVISSTSLFLDFISISEQRTLLAKVVSAVGQSFCETVKFALSSAVKEGGSGDGSCGLLFKSGRRFTENMTNLVSHVSQMKWDCITKKF